MILWLKAFHIIFLVTWFAGLFYLPRLFVYHTDLSSDSSNEYNRFSTMERRLYWGIMTPSAVITVFLGLDLIHRMRYSFRSLPHWLQLKIGLVLILLGFHVYCGYLLKQFKCNRNTRSSLFYRWFNEIPTVILIMVVCLAVVKPQF